MPCVDNELNPLLHPKYCPLIFKQFPCHDPDEQAMWALTGTHFGAGIISEAVADLGFAFCTLRAKKIRLQKREETGVRLAMDAMLWSRGITCACWLLWGLLSRTNASIRAIRDWCSWVRSDGFSEFQWSWNGCAGWFWWSRQWTRPDGKKNDKFDMCQEQTFERLKLSKYDISRVKRYLGCYIWGYGDRHVSLK